jgi:hypothetical protein
MPPDCLSPEALPTGMLRGDREADQDFSPEENLFWRFKEFVPQELRLVNQSVNRSKHGCQPEWILLPCYSAYGYGVFKVRDIPPFKITDGSVRYDFRVEHVPEDFNYCHSEIHVYKDGERFNGRIKANAVMKEEYRMAIYDSIEVIKHPNNTITPE